MKKRIAVVAVVVLTTCASLALSVDKNATKPSLKAASAEER